MESFLFIGKDINYLYGRLTYFGVSTCIKVGLNVAYKTLGKAIGNPKLPWVEFTNDETLNGIIKKYSFFGLQ